MLGSKGAGVLKEPYTFLSTDDRPPLKGGQPQRLPVCPQLLSLLISSPPSSHVTFLPWPSRLRSTFFPPPARDASPSPAFPWEGEASSEGAQAGHLAGVTGSNP